MAQMQGMAILNSSASNFYRDEMAITISALFFNQNSSVETCLCLSNLVREGLKDAPEEFAREMQLLL